MSEKIKVALAGSHKLWAQHPDTRDGGEEMPTRTRTRTGTGTGTNKGAGKETRERGRGERESPGTYEILVKVG